MKWICERKTVAEYRREAEGYTNISVIENEANSKFKIHLAYLYVKWITVLLSQNRTRPDTRPPVADGWAGVDMRVFPLFDSMVTNGRTDGRTKPLIELRVRN